MLTARRPDTPSRRRAIVWRVIVAIAVVLVLSGLVARTIQAFPKPYNPNKVVWQTTPRLTITPSGLLTPHDTNVIAYLAQQISQAGVPIRVVIREVAEAPIDIGADASTRANFYPVESKPGAQDGLLMLVEIPAEDHTRTQVGFAVGKNFFPNGGLTYESLMEIKYQRIQPKIDQNTIGAALIDGLNWIAWTNQFESSPRLEPATWQDRMQRAIDLAIAPLLGLYALAVIGMGVRARIMTRRLAAHPSMTPRDVPDIPADSVHLGALARGQVDDPVMAGVLLQMVAAGAISVTSSGRARGLRLLDPKCCQTEAQRQLYGLLSHMTETDVVNASRLRQLPDLWAPLRREMSARFAAAGLFTPIVRPVNRLVRRLCVIGCVLAAIVLVISTLSMARWGILAGVGLAAIAAVVWWWTSQWSHDTDAARSSVHSPDRYLPRNEQEAIELSIFRWIVTRELSPSRLLSAGGAGMSLAEERVRAAATQFDTAILRYYAA